MTGGSFNYDASLTPAVSAVSPTSSSVLGGDILTIDGTAFGAQWGQVSCGLVAESVVWCSGTAGRGPVRGAHLVPDPDHLHSPLQHTRRLPCPCLRPRYVLFMLYCVLGLTPGDCR